MSNSRQIAAVPKNAAGYNPGAIKRGEAYRAPAPVPTPKPTPEAPEEEGGVSSPSPITDPLGNLPLLGGLLGGGGGSGGLLGGLLGGGGGGILGGLIPGIKKREAIIGGTLSGLPVGSLLSTATSLAGPLTGGLGGVTGVLPVGGLLPFKARDVESPGLIKRLLGLVTSLIPTATSLLGAAGDVGGTATGLVGGGLGG